MKARTATIPVRPFPKRAVTEPGVFHNLGPVVTPAEQAKAKHADAPPHEVAAAARQAMDALAGSGPSQTPAHSDTALALETALARLRDHAIEGDAAAFAWLGYVLRNAVADFHEVARRNPDVAAAWGETQNTLPVLAGRNKGHAREAESLFTLFRLGGKSPYRVNPEARAGGHAPDAANAVNALAAGLCQHLAVHRLPVAAMRAPVPAWARLASRLPELSRETADAWADAAKELLKSSFSNDADLVAHCELGDSREFESEGDGVGKQVAEIHRRIRRAIHSLAAKG